MNSDEVQSVLHLSSACADEARTPQLRAAGQITGVRPGITHVLGERQRVQGARAPCRSSASSLALSRSASAHKNAVATL